RGEQLIPRANNLAARVGEAAAEMMEHVTAPRSYRDELSFRPPRRQIVEALAKSQIAARLLFEYIEKIALVQGEGLTAAELVVNAGDDAPQIVDRVAVLEKGQRSALAPAACRHVLVATE